MNNEEKWDIYDGNKQRTGKSKYRFSEKLEEGEYIVGIQAVIINSNKEILISQRSQNKTSSPLKWECTGGGLLSGEESFQGTVREIREELGIDMRGEKEILFKTKKGNRGFKDIYLFKKDIDIDSLEFNDGEVNNAKWVSIDEFEAFKEKGLMVNNPDFDRDDYIKALDILNFV